MIIDSDRTSGLSFTTDGETFEIEKYVLVTGNVAGVGGAFPPVVYSSHDQSTLINSGMIVNSTFGGSGVFLQGGSANITNTSDGLIRTGPLGTGILFGSSSELVLKNQGEIIGNIGLNVSDGLALIDNQAGGLIQGEEFSLHSGVGGSAGRYAVSNRGTISGDIDLRSNFSDVIINHGKIFGDIALGPGADTFRDFGSSSNTVSGDAGADILAPGRGRDFLRGGTEADRFDFNSIKDSMVGPKRDQILDFSRADHDKIDLKTIDAKTGVAGNNAFKFIGKQDFHDRKGELRYEDKGATCIVQGDRNGDGKADFEIFVAVGSLLKGDFLL